MQPGLLAILQAVASMPLDQKRARYSELAGKVAALVALKNEELHELIMLRNLLQKHAVQFSSPARESEFGSPILL